MKRGSVKVNESELIALWVPRPLLAAMDREIAIEDSDRSKFIRRAIRHRIKGLGRPIPDQDPA